MSDMPATTREVGDSSDAKVRMILVAERLIAEGGIASVSMREIAAKAGQRNHFAVQYHFGSREGLVQAIFDHRMAEMEPRRGALLARAAAGGKLADPRTLLEIVYLPQLALQDAEGRHSYAGFLCQYLLRHRSWRFGEFSDDTPPHLARTLQLLRERIDHLPEDVAQRRLVSSSLMFVHILIHHGDPDWRGQTGESFDAALQDTLDQITVCMTAPLIR